MLWHEVTFAAALVCSGRDNPSDDDEHEAMKGHACSESDESVEQNRRVDGRSSEVRMRQSQAWALTLAPIVDEVLQKGFQNYEQLAQELDARGVKTRQGCRWSEDTAGHLYRTLAAMGRIPSPMSYERYRACQRSPRNHEAVERNRQALRDNADDFARGMAPILASLRAHGCTNPGLLAAELNARGIMPQRASQWTYWNVRHLIERLREMTSRRDDNGAGSPNRTSR